MNLNQFNNDTQDRLQRIGELKAEINADKTKLAAQKESYEQAIIDGKDKEADKIFPSIEGLNKQISSKQYRLDSISKVTNETIKNNAYDTMFELKAIEKDYQAKLDELDEEMKPLLLKQAALFEQANKIKNQYYTDKREYESLERDYKLERKELSKRGYYHDRAEPMMFRTTKAAPPAIQRPARKMNRQEKLSNLPDGATLEDFAKAARIID